MKILDLGCGTGRHAELLSKNFEVHGIDMSEEMLKSAFKRSVNNEKLNFSQGRLQDFNVTNKFDVILALFHVMSYQTTDKEIFDALKNIHRHLKPNGIFIFDCWYGPAVLTQQPTLRVKRMSDEKIEITRIAEPLMRENENIVEVHYDLFIKDKIQNNIEELREVHTMRYFFLSEIKKFLQSTDFNLIDNFEFMTGQALSKNTWGSCFVTKI